MNQSNYRISGLDPTNSGFSKPTTNSNYLTALAISDAEFVDVIHTDAGFQGDETELGTADFWPNFGHRRQPGCEASNAYNKETTKNGSIFIWKNINTKAINNGSWIWTILDLCSHKRAYQYWAESVTSENKDTFLAVEAKNFTYFRNGALNLSLLATMGINCSLRYIFFFNLVIECGNNEINIKFYFSTIKANYYLQTNKSPPYSRRVAGIIYTP